jgi:hypothetical protein
VKVPRFRIASIMLIVAITALDLGAIRAISDFESRFLFLLCVVTLPMANILAVGLLLAFLRPRSRHFLRGFEVFGAIALVFFVVLAMRAEGLVQFYLIPPMALYGTTIGPPPSIRQSWPSYQLLVGFCFLSLWATWPQLVFALMGGFVYQRSEATGRHDRTHG